MYTTTIFKTVWTGDLPNEGSVFEQLKYLSEQYPDCVSLQYQLELPFAPYPGLSITDEADNFYFRSGKIVEVTRFNEKKEFGCWVEDEKPHGSRGYDYSYEWLVNHALKEGWKLAK